MPEVLDIITSDDADDAVEPFAGGMAPPRRWRRRTAVVVVVALAIAVAYVVSTSTKPSSEQRPPAHSTTVDERPSATPQEDVARAGLAAWGRFAVSGNLDELRPYFHQDGPQWTRFVDESSKISGAPPGPPAYTFTLVSPQVVPGDGDDQLVEADVVVSRPGETDQHFSWEILMRKSNDGRWTIWTVRDRAASGPAAPNGGPS